MLTGRINAIVKSALSIDTGRTAFVLKPGETLSDVERRLGWKVSVNDIVKANGGLSPEKYRAWKRYAIRPGSAKPPKPAAATSVSAKATGASSTGTTDTRKYPWPLNNPGNMSYAGGRRASQRKSETSRFAKYDTPVAGGTDATLRLMEIASRIKNPTLDKILDIYSPPIENDVKKHKRNILSIGGLPSGYVPDFTDKASTIKLMHGLFGAESGRKAERYFTDEEYSKMYDDAWSTFHGQGS